MQNKKNVTPLPPPPSFFSLWIGQELNWHLNKMEYGSHRHCGSQRGKNADTAHPPLPTVSSSGHFCTQNDPNFRWIFTHNSKNKNRKICLFRFSFYSAHSACGHVTIKDMQTPPPSQKWRKLYERCGMCWIEREK